MLICLGFIFLLMRNLLFVTANSITDFLCILEENTYLTKIKKATFK